MADYGIIRGMKFVACVLLLFVSLAVAAGIAVGPLPVPDYADPEVSTNFAFSVEHGFRVRLL